MDKLTVEKDTKALLLDCAEQLFLAKGFDAVSVREITEAAGANIAAVNYHYNGKGALYRAFLERRFAETAAQKVALIEQSSRAAALPTLQSIIAAYVRNNLEDMIADDRLLRIIYREISPEGLASDLVTNVLITPIHRALFGAIRRVCPQLPDKYISRCISSLAGQILHFIRFREAINTFVLSRSKTEYIDEVTDHITAFTLRGIGSQHDEKPA